MRARTLESHFVRGLVDRESRYVGIKGSREQGIKVLCALCVSVVSILGCGIQPAVMMSTAQTVRTATAGLRDAAREWAADVETGDTSREARAIAAFVTRLRADGEDEDQIATDTAQFTAALAKLRADRWAADERLRIVMDNCDALDEQADALHQLAVDTQSLDDEWRRYIGRAWDTYKQSQTEAATARQQAQAARQAQRQALVQQLIGTILPAKTPAPAASGN